MIRHYIVPDNVHLTGSIHLEAASASVSFAATVASLQRTDGWFNGVGIMHAADNLTLAL